MTAASGLTLYYHPLSSYCWKVLIAFHENGTQVTLRQLDMSNEASAQELHALWPMDRFPVLRDDGRGVTLPESSVIIEHVTHFYPGSFAPFPADKADGLQVRLWDRFFDNFVMTPMQEIVFDRIRPADRRDPHGVEAARVQLTKAYALLEDRLAGREWAVGSAISLADCAAAPALFYADKVEPFRDAFPAVGAYLDRLEALPSFARVLADAEPYFALFPSEG